MPICYFKNGNARKNRRGVGLPDRFDISRERDPSDAEGDQWPSYGGQAPAGSAFSHGAALWASAPDHTSSCGRKAGLLACFAVRVSAEYEQGELFYGGQWGPRVA